MTQWADQWSFHNPVRIHAGPGALSTLPSLIGVLGGVLVVTSQGFVSRGGVDRLRSLLPERSLHIIDDISPNPDLSDVEERLARIRAAGVRCVIGIGGGSVLDTAKMLAVALGAPAGTLRRHVFEREALPVRRDLRLLCVPTTAGTGSEVTPFATVWDRSAKKKYSVAADVMFPDVALLDAELTLTMPDDVTVSTGLDAITQAFEATWSRGANAVSSAFATRAIRLALRALPALIGDPANLSLRSAMLESSLLAGLAISRTRTALCHSISYPITAHFGLPHGYACAFTLPEVFAFNLAVDEERFQQLAAEVGFSSADELHHVLHELLERLRLAHRLRPYIGDGSAVAGFASEMLTPGRADNNLRAATVDDVAMIVAAACRGRGLSV